MKFAVILPSRGRPELLMSVLTAFRHLESGFNEVKYFVRLDNDDRTICEIEERVEKLATVLYGDTPPTVATKAISIINSSAFKEFDPEFYVLMSDDVFPLCQGWDQIIIEASNKFGDAFSWQEQNFLTGTSYLIMRKKYVQSLKKFLPEYFPFWFVDVWHAEIYFLASGHPMPIVDVLKLGGKRGKTRGMKDLEFWFKFFAATRLERMEEAKRIMNVYNLPVRSDWDKILKLFEDGDSVQIDKAKTYEDLFAGEPIGTYASALENAKKYMAFLEEKYLLHN